PKPGSAVYAAEHLTVNGGRIAVRFGASGVVQEIQESSGLFIVTFAESIPPGQKFAVSSEQLELAAPYRQGQWLQLKSDISFRSKRVLRAGQPCVVRDVRCGSAMLVVRMAPVAAVDAFDLSVSPEDVEALVGLPASFSNSCGALPEGFAPADIVFATADIAVQGPSGPTVAVGLGDVGMVFGEPTTPEARSKGEVLVRFEARQDQGNPVFLSVLAKSLSRSPLLSCGKRAEVKKPLQFPDGFVADVGSVGIVVQSVVDGHEADVVQIHDGTKEKSFQPLPGTVSLLHDPKVTSDELEARLRELETLATLFDAAGKHGRTVSMLEQNLWAALGMGTGVNLSFLAHQSKWPRLGTLSLEGKCLTLKTTSAEGMDGTLGGESKVRFDHEALIHDATRVDPYAAAIRAAAKGKTVLDIGTGPVCFLARLCLRAGARAADAVESNTSSVERAVGFFEAEARGETSSTGRILPSWAALPNVQEVRREEHAVSVRLTGAELGDQELQLFCGLSTDPDLRLRGRGSYTMLVHEILGDMAGNEDAALVLDDIHQRGLLAPDSVVIPRASSTLLAPTEVLNRTTMEKLVHRLGHSGDGDIKPLTRHSARRFPSAALLADAQALELLDFAKGPQLLQERTLEFRTTRPGDFDGVHMHLHVDLDGANSIDVLGAHSGPDSDSSWSTVYVRLLSKPMALAAGSRIVCRCRADLRDRPARYRLSVAVGEEGSEQHVCDGFEWSGG
ncbi:unnamed protein product, partial [Symbiodinium sp. CCMP2456]